MNAQERLIYALECELDNADFSTKQSRDDSYQLLVTKIEEICNLESDNSLSIHDIVKTMNIVDDLEPSLRKAYKAALKYLNSSICTKKETETKKVYIVQFDWSTSDAGSVDLFVYGDYNDAYDKFKELILGERNPEMSWVGDIEFDDEGYPIDDNYEFEFEDNNSCESEVYWHIMDKDDWHIHSFIDLRIMEVK